MRIATVVVLFLMLARSVVPAQAEATPSAIEQAMSESLDLWRNGSYEQLFERLSNRGHTTKEQFVKKMREAQVHPACCWQKLENFRVLNERPTAATVYARVGLDGNPQQPGGSSTREFKLSFEEGVWKMHMSDVFALAGVGSKKRR